MFELIEWRKDNSSKFGFSFSKLLIISKAASGYMYNSDTLLPTTVGIIVSLIRLTNLNFSKSDNADKIFILKPKSFPYWEP